MNLKICLTLLIISQSFQVQGRFACPLVWIKSAGKDSIPFNSVPSRAGDTKNFIARVQTSTNTYIGGRYTTISGTAYIVNSGDTEGHTVYEILTNPNTCILQWVDQGSESVDLRVPYGNTASPHVGRAELALNKYTGEVNRNILTLASGIGSVDYRTEFQVLESFSTGLRLEMTNFEFFNDNIPPINDFVGIDEIYNNADMEVIQTTTFRKRILESTTVTTESSWGFVMNFGFKIGTALSFEVEDPSGNVSMSISGPTLEFEVSFETEFSKYESITRGHQTEIEIGRDIIIPPYTRVQVCAVINIKDNFEMEYDAIGRYYAPGLNSQQVGNILAQDGLTGIPEGNAVLVSRRGTFKGTLVINNRFMVTPIEEGMDCAMLGRMISKLNQMRRQVARGQLKMNDKELWEEEQRINQFIVNITTITNRNHVPNFA